MTSPEVWVALRWFPPAAQPFDSVVDRSATRPEVTEVRRGQTAKSAERIDPLWTKQAEILIPMGMPSYDDIVAVAAYTRENLVAGRDVVVYYRGRTADGVLHMPYRAAPLEAETMRAWR